MNNYLTVLLIYHNIVKITNANYYNIALIVLDTKLTYVTI